MLRTAMELADRDGLDVLSMRRLAAELGVEAMSLYYYVNSKDDILAGIVDLALAEVEPPAEGHDWKAAVRRSAISYHETLLRHPWVTSVPPSGEPSVAQLRYMDVLLRRLREAGLAPELTHHAYHALDSHIVGSALWLARIPPKAELDVLARDVLARIPAEIYPDLVLHIGQHLSGAARGLRFFEFGLDLIIEGIELRRENVVPDASGA
ncbi:MAG TPA: TetR/AcrR family transcriptional regulator C-terminal domain-containing protein [Candidatus Limnocylindrales bacterium]|nr:TetR/AcrR family transcriptional regulator C-terminal domain-containing protein [Candidatus Limnocylindrales bacterium]